VHFFSGQLAAGAQRYFPLYEVVCVARSLCEGRGFASPLPSASGPTAMVTPVFPFLLAGVFKLFGSLSLASSVVVRILDILFSALTCLPIAAIGRRLAGPSVGALAAWIWALLPASVFYSVVWIWDTTLSVLLLTTALAITFWVAERADRKSWSVLGFVFGLGTLVNSALLPVVPGCLAFAAYQARKRGVSWWRTAGISTLAFSITLAPWVIRNEVVFRGQVLLRSNLGLELWLGNNPQVPISCACWLHPSHQPEERARFLALGEVAYMQEKQQQALDFIKTHPSTTLRFVYHRFMETWTGFPDSFIDIWAGGELSLRASLVLNYSFTLLSLAGLLLARRRSPLLSLPLLNLMVVFPVLYYVCHTDPRYRQPIEPVMAVLTALALAESLRAVRAYLSLRQHKQLTEDLPAV